MARRSISDWYTPIRMPTLADAPPRQESLGDTISGAIKYNKESRRQDQELELRKKQLKIQEDAAKLETKKLEMEVAAKEKQTAKEDEYDNLMSDPLALSPAVEEKSQPGMLRRISDYAGFTKPEPTAPEPGPVSDDFRRAQALELSGQGEEAGKFRNQQISQFNALGGAATPEGREYFNQVISGGQGSMKEPPIDWKTAEVNGDLVAYNPRTLEQRTMVDNPDKLIQLGMGGQLRDATGKLIASNPYQAGGGGSGSRAATADLKELGKAANDLAKEALQYDKMAQGAMSAAANIRAGKIDTIAAMIAEAQGVNPLTIPTMSQEAKEALAASIEGNIGVWREQANAARRQAQEYRDIHRERLGVNPAPSPVVPHPPSAGMDSDSPEYLGMPVQIGGPMAPSTVPTHPAVNNAKDLLNRLRKGK
jgi:hypothetical protein